MLQAVAGTHKSLKLNKYWSFYRHRNEKNSDLGCFGLVFICNMCIFGGRWVVPGQFYLCLAPIPDRRGKNYITTTGRNCRRRPLHRSAINKTSPLSSAISQPKTNSRVEGLCRFRVHEGFSAVILFLMRRSDHVNSTIASFSQ